MVAFRKDVLNKTREDYDNEMEESRLILEYADLNDRMEEIVERMTELDMFETEQPIKKVLYNDICPANSRLILQQEGNRILVSFVAQASR